MHPDHTTLHIVLIAAAMLVLGAAAMFLGKRSSPFSVKARPLLTPREEAMYNRLRTAWPNGHVLAQVAMSALLRTRKQADRNRFDRKVCDFVLVDKSFVVKVIIELDDSSHRGRENADRTRDTMLKRAGYETLRFVNVPDANELVAGLAAFEPASSQIHGVS